MLRQSEQQAGEDPGTTGGWGGHDDPHGGVHFLDREGGRKDVGEHRTSERPDWSHQPGGIAADQPAHAAKVPGKSAGHCATHHFERPVERRLDLGPCPQPIGRLGPESQLAETEPFRLRPFDGLGEGLEHQAILGIDRIMLTPGMVRSTSMA
jgi:hypothetical protein